MRWVALRWVVAAGAALSISSPLMAQAEKADFEVTQIVLDPLPNEKSGHAAVFSGELEAGKEDHLILSDLSIFQPVAVIVSAQDPARPMVTRLGKFGWREDEGGGTTDSKGGFSKRFRTQGDLLISVGAPKGGTYKLAIWRGVEVPPPMDKVLVEPGEADAGINKYLLIGLIVAVVLGGVLWVLSRRRKAGAVQ